MSKNTTCYKVTIIFLVLAFIISLGFNCSQFHQANDARSYCEDLETEIDGMQKELSYYYKRTGVVSGRQANSFKYIGNVETNVFHRKNCSYLPADPNQIRLPSRFNAEASGYRPCGHCDP